LIEQNEAEATPVHPRGRKFFRALAIKGGLHV
jgi:hypothetical protein